MRREYKIEPIVVNKTLITSLIIDDHVDKHFDHLNDAFIIELVKLLNAQELIPIRVVEKFSYFETQIKKFNRYYKLIWLLEKNREYIGIITVYMDRRIKNGFPN